MSATASDDAEAPLQYKIPVVHVNKRLENVEKKGSGVPFSAKTSTSAQSYPAPAEAKTFAEEGRSEMSSLSQRPISPPEFQKGRKIAEKLPHCCSLRAFKKASLCLSSMVGRMIVAISSNALYRSGLYCIGSPIWSTIGLTALGILWSCCGCQDLLSCWAGNSLDLSYNMSRTGENTQS